MSTLKIQLISLSMGAAVDQQTGSLSIFDLLEELRTPKVPVQVQNLVLSLALEKTVTMDFQGKLVIGFIAPDGSQQVVGSGEMKIPIDQKRIKAIFRFGGFLIQHFGVHRFVVSCFNHSDAKEVEAGLEFEVVQLLASGHISSPTQKTPTAH